VRLPECPIGPSSVRVPGCGHVEVHRGAPSLRAVPVPVGQAAHGPSGRVREGAGQGVSELRGVVGAGPDRGSAREQPEERVVGCCLGDFQFDQLAGIAADEVRHFGPARKVPGAVELVSDARLTRPEQDNVATG